MAKTDWQRVLKDWAWMTVAVIGLVAMFAGLTCMFLALGWISVKLFVILPVWLRWVIGFLTLTLVFSWMARADKWDI